MWIVRLALRRTYTFVVLAVLIAVLGAVSTNRMATDIFPEADIPVVTIVWQYTGANSGKEPWTFDSSFISSARRLPNGNTLIDEGMNGRFFQVTPQGEIVWEYVNPYFGKAMAADKDVDTNWTFRATPVIAR